MCILLLILQETSFIQNRIILQKAGPWGTTGCRWYGSVLFVARVKLQWMMKDFLGEKKQFLS